MKVWWLSFIKLNLAIVKSCVYQRIIFVKIFGIVKNNGMRDLYVEKIFFFKRDA
jgi:hypothetical protein